MKNISIIVCVCLSAICCLQKGFSQDTYDPSVPEPTLKEVSYGDHKRHVLDFWQAESAVPTPLVFVVHGGGWVGGSKERVQRFADVQQLLDAGISVAAINYRLIKKKGNSDETPPVKAPMYDAARALQFVRSKAKEWNIDKHTIGAAGGSAGACTALWLAFHDDLAEAESEDQIKRESTRLFCAAVVGAQTSLDPTQMKSWIPEISYGNYAFEKEGFDEFLASRDSILPWIKSYSPYELVSADDPPVYLHYGKAPGTEKTRGQNTHSAIFGVELQKHCNALGIKCDVNYPDAPNIKYISPTDYLIKTLHR